MNDTTLTLGKFREQTKDCDDGALLVWRAYYKGAMFVSYAEKDLQVTPPFPHALNPQTCLVLTPDSRYPTLSETVREMGGGRPGNPNVLMEKSAALFAEIKRLAETHGSGDEPDHEVGDLQDVLQACLEIMTVKQLDALNASQTLEDLRVLCSDGAYSYEEWQLEVRDGNTKRSYEDWVEAKKEEAENDGLD